ncbi:uncharacterized protein LOC120205612 [Hibiscus syriacus]|uniref:uncharacterized protein LOC120205612 n=1 Tax=Hibiscus syriacus TaxID=106335 RepID=UPI001921FCE6|nr:uncharacterized protein LOC120205612 [Hibiscus syriacus]XP_039061401.1 uncharacterized protein LOC120205612 [Hibiscus syriacus]
MSLENDRHSLDQPVEFSKESQKTSIISYTREFLLSLSELDACKKLPSGFDQSILSEFEDTSQDRQRIPGTLSGYRRNEYGTSPPTRGDSCNYSRGIHERWDTRHVGRSDRDNDSQPDRETDAGRRIGNQSRWQGPERDGLLGSGSFPRPSGYRAGASAPKLRANDQYHLNKTTEPYHPPRPYKAAPHSRRETNDSFNDETFGSTECTNEDRVEEERKRRASFESWRKEALQEKKINPERLKGDFDISELLVDSKDDKGLPNTSKELEEPMPASNIDLDKSSRPSQAPASRPLVPPGFAGSILERNLGNKTSKHSHSSQAGSSETEGSLTDAKGILMLNGTSDGDLLRKHSKQHAVGTLNEQQLESTGIHLLADNKSGKALNFLSALDKSNERLSVDSQLYKISSISEAFEVPVNTIVTETDSKNLLVDKLLTKTNQDGRSTSILDKLFCSALTPKVGGSSNFTEPNDSKPDDLLAPDTSHSSKFAHLFLEEENKKPIDDLSTGRPKDLLSLIQSGEKGVSHVSDVVATAHVTPNFPFQIPGLADGHVVSNLMSHGIENSEQSCYTHDFNKPTAVPAVLTCEDLEKSILSGSIENDPVLPPAVEGRKIIDAQTEKQEVDVDDHASQHLLSLLQNKTSMKSVKSSTSLDIIKASKTVQNIETSVHSAPHDSIEVNAENASSSGKPLTLEALFGSAFMKELQSAGAPASIHRGSAESARVDVLESNGLPLHVTNDSILPSTVHIGSNMTTFETNILSFSQREQIKSDGIEEHFLGYDDGQSVVGSSHLRSELGPRGGDLNRSAEIQLPEEDILIGVSSPGQLHKLHGW